MNNKKLLLSILYVVLLSLLIGSAILFSKPSGKDNFIFRAMNEKESNAVAADNSNQNMFIFRNEAINVSNNQPDLNVQVNLIENRNGEVLLNIAYKMNGRHVKKAIDTSSIAEIRNIFRFREKYGSGYRLNKVSLNKKQDKLYFGIEGKQDKKLTQTTIYSYDLNDFKIEKVFSGIGAFSDFYFSPDGKYNAFSYLNNPESTDENERNKVTIVHCQDNKLILKGNNDIAGKTLGDNNALYIYSYDFIKWQNNSICKLEQVSKVKDGSQKIKKQTVYFNVVSNKLSDKF